jgi:hypothetical protein
MFGKYLKGNEVEASISKSEVSKLPVIKDDGSIEKPKVEEKKVEVVNRLVDSDRPEVKKQVLEVESGGKGGKNEVKVEQVKNVKISDFVEYEKNCGVIDGKVIVRSQKGVYFVKDK